MKKDITAICSIIIIINLVSVFWIFTSLGCSSNAYLNKIIHIDNNWSYTTASTNQSSTISLPCNITRLPKNDTITIRNTLPSDTIESPKLIIRTELQSIEVYINDCLIFANNKNSAQLFGKSPESSWCFIDLPRDYQNKDIKITYTSSYKNFTGKLNNIIICPDEYAKSYIFYSYMPKIIVSFLILAIGIILCAIYAGVRNCGKKYVNVLYLGILDIVFFNWTMFENKVGELFISTYFPSAELKIIDLYLIPVLFNLFLRESVDDKNKSLFTCNAYFYVIILMINSALHFTNMAHYVETLPTMHGLMIINIIIIIRTLIKSIKLNEHATKNTLLATLIFLAPMLVYMFTYYTFKINTKLPIFEVSFLIFSIMFAIILGRIFFKMYNKELEAQLYKKMAYTDSLTGICNRTAYINKITWINELKELDYDIYIFIFDLNNLKKVNDHYGHSEGDIYIKSSLNILKNILSEYGTLYRTGGDEFTFINDKYMPINKCLKELNNHCLDLNSKYDDMNLGIAYGYSSFTIPAKDFASVYSVADKNMYKKKNEMKAKDL